jgi:hypothetical protein
MISVSRGRVAFLVYILVQTLLLSMQKGIPPHQRAEIVKLKHTLLNIFIHIVYFKLAPSLQKMFFFYPGGDLFYLSGRI